MIGSTTGKQAHSPFPFSPLLLETRRGCSGSSPFLVRRPHYLRRYAVVELHSGALQWSLEALTPQLGCFLWRTSVVWRIRWEPLISSMDSYIVLMRGSFLTSVVVMETKEKTCVYLRLAHSDLTLRGVNKSWLGDSSSILYRCINVHCQSWRSDEQEEISSALGAPKLRCSHVSSTVGSRSNGDLRSYVTFVESPSRSPLIMHMSKGSSDDHWISIPRPARSHGVLLAHQIFARLNSGLRVLFPKPKGGPLSFCPLLARLMSRTVSRASPTRLSFVLGLDYVF